LETRPDITFQNNLNSLVLCNNGRRLVVGLSDRVTIIDQQPDGKWQPTQNFNAGRAVEAVASNRSGTKLCIAYNGAAQMIEQDAKGGAWTPGPLVNGVNARDIAFSGDGKWLALIPSALDNRNISMFDNPQGAGWNGKIVNFGATTTPNSVALGRNASRMVVGYSGGTGVIVSCKLPVLDPVGFNQYWPSIKNVVVEPGSVDSWQVALSDNEMRLAIGYKEIIVLELAFEPLVRKSIPDREGTPVDLRGMVLKTIDNLTIDQYEFVRNLYTMQMTNMLSGFVILTPSQLKVFRTFSEPIRLALKRLYNLTIPSVVDAARKKAKGHRG